MIFFLNKYNVRQYSQDKVSRIYSEYQFQRDHTTYQRKEVNVHDLHSTYGLLEELQLWFEAIQSS